MTLTENTEKQIESTETKSTDELHWVWIILGFIGVLLYLMRYLIFFGILFVLGKTIWNYYTSTPGYVTESFFELANEGEYTELETLLSTESKEMLKLHPQSGGLKGFCEQITRNGTLDKVDITKEEVRGEGATIYATLRFTDGSTQKDRTSLRKEDGDWRIAP